MVPGCLMQLFGRSRVVVCLRKSTYFTILINVLFCLTEYITLHINERVILFGRIHYPKIDLVNMLSYFICT